ncbi:MAG: hypothetical protein ACFFBD_06655 [Candidatus Hodarchaeota archaeon]
MSNFRIRTGFLFFVLLSIVIVFVQPLSSASAFHPCSDQTDKLNFQPLVPNKFTGVKDVTTFVGPDSASSTIISYLQSAKNSIHIEIYAISNYFLLQELYAAKARNASMDIQVLLSYNHASSFDRSNTLGSAYNLSQSEFLFILAVICILLLMRNFGLLMESQPLSTPETGLRPVFLLIVVMAIGSGESL